MKPWLSPASTPLDPISSSRWSMAGQLQFAATVPQFSVEVVSHRRNGPPLQFDVLVCKECGYVLPRWSQSIQFPPVHMVSSVFAIGADRKSTRLNSSHGYISYAVFCLKKKKTTPLTISFTALSRP